MIRFIVALFFVATSLVVGSTNLAAAEQPCVPDCPQSTYNGPYKQILQLSPTCFVQVTFWRRLACGYNQDVAITEVRILSVPGCNFYNTAVFLETVTRELLKYTSGTIPQDTCKTQWRVAKASCWRSDTTNPCGDTLMVPCSGVGCCLVAYEICGDTNLPGGKSVRPTDIVSTGTCTDTSRWSPCRNACDTTGDGSIGLRTTSINDPLQPNAISVYPNPADMTLKVAASTAQLALCDRMFVTDLQGQRRIEVKLSDVDRTSGTIIINVSSLASGIYLVTCSGADARFSAQFSVQR